MEENISVPQATLVVAIVDKHIAKDVISRLRELGVKGLTVFLAKGTAGHRLLKALGLDEVAKDIILSAMPSDEADFAMDDICARFDMTSPSKGIIFSVALINSVGGIHAGIHAKEGAAHAMGSEFDLILTIVNRGFAEEVVDASKEAGATGGTIINARGTGIHENFSFFGVKIEPEKEIVLSIVKKEITGGALGRIDKRMELSKPGNGLAIVLPVSRALGITPVAAKE